MFFFKLVCSSQTILSGMCSAQYTLCNVHVYHDGYMNVDGWMDALARMGTRKQWVRSRAMVDGGGDKELAFRIFQILPRTLPLPLGFTGLCVRASGRVLS